MRYQAEISAFNPRLRNNKFLGLGRRVNGLGGTVSKLVQ